MSARAILVRTGIAVAFVAGALILLTVLYNLNVIPGEISPFLTYQAAVILGALWLLQSISGQLRKMLFPSLGERAYSLVNIFKILGYIILAIVGLSLLGVSPEVALAGGAFSGLIIGLGAQPILGNFFAGLVVLLTGFVKAGDEIRVAASAIPYSVAVLPAYKYFSPDYIYMGYRGRIIEVGLFYSTMTTETGLELRIPNNVILNSAVIDYTPSHTVMRKYQVRYEFKNDLDPDTVLQKVKETLSTLPEVRNVFINEQSDKEYYIILVEFYLGFDADWRGFKSEILRRLVKVHRALRQPGQAR